MVGLVISDSFLLVGEWDSTLDYYSLKGVSKIDYAENISQSIFNEASLSNALASSLRKAQESFSFSGKKVIVGIPDHFVEHSVLNIEQDLSHNEHLEYMKWMDYQKRRPENKSVYIFGQTYYPSLENIHVCTVSRALIRTLKLSLSEMGGRPFWMGPLSSMYMDGKGERESAVISRIGNKYLFLKLQNNIFDVGTIAFSGVVPRIISSTDFSEDNVFSALGFQESNEENIPVFCAQKLGRQAKNAWDLSDYRSSIPFENIKLESKVNRLPFYEANILSALITNQSINFSFNLFEDEGIVEFFFDEVYSEIDDKEDEDENKKDKQDIIEKRQDLEELKQEDIEESIEKMLKKNKNLL